MEEREGQLLTTKYLFFPARCSHRTQTNSLGLECLTDHAGKSGNWSGRFPKAFRLQTDWLPSTDASSDTTPIFSRLRSQSG
jgi:hypothetical protein